MTNMSFDRGSKVGARSSSASPSLPQHAPGKQTLTQYLPSGSAVQRKSDGSTSDADTPHDAASASHSISGASSALSHRDTIHRLFGRHDAGHTNTHVRGAEFETAHVLGARAHAMGAHDAFVTSPSLHTASHEAANVSQHHAGVHLNGDVGEVGDSYAWAADAASDRVLRDLPAHNLILDPGSKMTEVQRSAVKFDNEVDEDSEVGDKEKKRHPPQKQTEHLKGTLWAKDAKGKDLPPSLEDIAQGTLNDCYLFAAMAALVHSDPGRIKSMIKNNHNGTYTVDFEGMSATKTEKQTVNDAFVKGRHGNLRRHALWPLIIEKAYAKALGGLDNLDTGGNPGAAVEDLKDLDAKNFRPHDKKPSEILARLSKAQKDRKPTTILSPPENKATKEQIKLSHTANLHFWHSYAVVGVDERARKIKLFNPWGSAQPGKAEDGWIGVDTLKTFFVEVDING